MPAVERAAAARSGLGRREDRLEAVEAKLDLLLEQVARLDRRARALEDLGGEGARVAREVLAVVEDELSEVEERFNAEQLARLARKLMRNTPRLIALLDALESLDDLMAEAGPLGKVVLADLAERLQAAEERGYLRLLRGGAALLDRVASHYTQDDIDRLSDNIVFILDTVKRMTQPEILGTVNQAVEVLDDASGEVQPLGLWGLVRAMRDPEVQRGVGALVAILKEVSRGPRAAHTNGTGEKGAPKGAEE